MLVIQSKKTSCNTKINEIEKKTTDDDHSNKYIATPEFNKLTAGNFAARLKQANLAGKSDIANLVNKTDFDEKLKYLNKKITSNRIKHVLVENEFKKVQTFHSRFFIGQIYFNNNGGQFYSIFQPIYKTIKTISGLKDTISEWESKGFSNEKFKPPHRANKVLSPKLLWNNSRLRLGFEVICLKQEDTTSFTPNNVVNLFIVYELEVV